MSKLLVPSPQPTEPGIQFVRLTSVLSPGGSAAGIIVFPLPNGNFKDSSLTVTLYDKHDRLEGATSGLYDGTEFGHNYGLPNEVFKARFNQATGLLECVGSQGLFRRGKLDANVTAGNSETVSIWRASGVASCTGSDSGEDVTACATVDGSLGDSVLVRYLPEFKNWFTVGVGSSGGAVGDIQIRNDSGATVNQFNVLAVGDPVTTFSTTLPASQGYPPTFKGTKPSTGSPGDWGKWCVVQEQISNGATGPAIMVGVTYVELATQGTVYDWTRVDIKDNSYLAEENWHGKAQLIYAENTTSPTARWAMINMGTYQAPRYQAIADGTIAAASSGSAEIQIGATKQTVTVYNDWMEGTHDIADEDEMHIWFNRHNNRFEVANVEC